MIKYSIDIKFVGYENVAVVANSAAEAHEKASEYFDDNYMECPLSTLRNKSTTTTILDNWEEFVTKDEEIEYLKARIAKLESERGY